MLKIAKPDQQAEIFYTVQGEGKNIGQPSIFVRTSLCNLHCVWCDTDYTWNWEGTRFAHVKDVEPGYEKYKMDEVVVEMSVEEIIRQIHLYPCTNVVLTGGEPMMQQESLCELMQGLGADYFFEVETNGTIIPNASFDHLIHQYNVSPKLANSGNSQKLREKNDVFQFFSRSPKAHFKFVLADQSDLQEILNLIDRYKIPSEKVYLMPEGTSAKQLNARQQWLVEICKEHGFHFTSRLHILIYGNKRGV
ncbi:MAG: 7-carboxy-7-deazaguanine synthase QueE [Chitinophagales bacterium]|nr:7-carboxy-7-deazaguanine synthase QueE [Chitinophagales bacterium]